MATSDPPTTRPSTRPFRGFSSPNYTPVPDELFDDLMVDLSGAELKALLYVIRRTFGFKRGADAISLSQMLNGLRTPDGRVLDRGIGLSKKTLLLTLRTLEERRIILTERRQSVEKGNEPTVYRLNVIGQAGPDDAGDGPAPLPGEESTPPLGEKVHQGGPGGESRPPLGEFLPLPPGGKSTPTPRGKNSPTQETVLRETVRRETDDRQTVVSIGFDNAATMRQSRESSGFSKATPSDAMSRQLAWASAARSRAEQRSGAPPPADPAPAPDANGAKTARRTAANGEDGSRQPIGGRWPSSARHGPLSGIRADDSRPAGRREPPPTLPPYLAELVSRYSEELHDPDHVPQNLGQAGRLWQVSGRSEASFGQALTEARAITLKSNIKKPARVGGDLGARNKMPFYFTVLRGLLGIKKERQPQPYVDG